MRIISGRGRGCRVRRWEAWIWFALPCLLADELSVDFACLLACLLLVGVTVDLAYTVLGLACGLSVRRVGWGSDTHFRAFLAMHGMAVGRPLPTDTGYMLGCSTAYTALIYSDDNRLSEHFSCSSEVFASSASLYSIFFPSSSPFSFSWLLRIIVVACCGWVDGQTGNSCGLYGKTRPGWEIVIWPDWIGHWYGYTRT